MLLFFLVNLGYSKVSIKMTLSVLKIYTPVLLRQDQLAADMYSFFSKEGEYARYFVTVSEGCVTLSKAKSEC